MSLDESEARIAREIQQRLLPKMPQLERFDIGAAMHPLNSAGGDFFDFIPMSDGSLGIVIGDVCGHGVGPALLMATTRAYLRVLARTHSDLGEILTLVNKMLSEDAEERFVTLFFAQLDIQRPSLRYADAGHGVSFLLRPSGGITHLNDSNTSGPPLGIGLENDYRVSLPMALERGDMLFLATDGLTECSSGDGRMFGFDPVIEIIRVNSNRRAQDIIGSLFAAAHFLLLRQGHGERIPGPNEVISMDGFLRVVEQYPDIRMVPDDMTAVVVKVE
jgi:sigma-B regulation protein RsbU (phosphoserine phosphatase)